MSNFNSADIAAFKDVWVFCEQREGKLMPTDFELISKGRDLANEFMDTLEGAPKGDIRGVMALLIDKQDDPRRVEVYSALQDLVLAGGR